MRTIRARLSSLSASATVWTSLDGGISTRVSGTASPALQAVAFDEVGTPLFSEPVRIDAGLAAEKRYDLEVKRGSSLKGRLSDRVKRPVRRGRVIANVERSLPEGDSLHWSVVTSIDPDGGFVLENLPQGDVQLVALCEGYVSQNPTGRPDCFKTALSFKPTEGAIEVPMEETGSAEIEVLSPDGRPIVGAQVIFSPNQIFGRSSSILGTEHDAAEYILNHQLAGNPEKVRNRGYRFEATTDAAGKVWVKELPAGGQEFGVFSNEFELWVDPKDPSPRRRSRGIEIRSGEMTSRSVEMHPKKKAP